MNLDTPVSKAGFTYARYASKLEKLGIMTLRDLIMHIPFRYDDLSLVSKIGKVQPGETVTIQGTVENIQNQYTKRRFVIQKAVVSDDSGFIECTWFNQPYITKTIHAGDKISIAGKVEQFGKKVIAVKDYEVLKEGKETVHTARLVPIYPATAGLSIKWMRNRIHDLLEQNVFEDYLPDSTVKKHKLKSLDNAIKTIHFPKNIDEADVAHERLSFDELLITQLAATTRREDWKKHTTSPKFEFKKHQKKIEQLWESLPFELTGAQRRALDDIFADVATSTPMNRLLQGDVGSGKTVVAAIAAYLAVLNGYQVALMAPTEILAQQHYATMTKLLEPLGVSISLETSSSKRFKNKDLGIKNKNLKSKFNLYPTSEIYKKGINPKSENPDITVGTHALIAKKIEFNKLGLVIIDEQQRFGVEQRAILRDKGDNPHFLTMTATPIPRTVLLTVYGDLDVSYIDEMPKGRQIIKTWFVPEAKRAGAYDWIKKQLDQLDTNGNKNQIFIICPFIEESENMTTVKAAKAEFDRLQKTVFKKYKLALLHGKQKGAEKDKILADFHAQKYDILVATPVVEVGIDIPNATVIVIEAAERFGLSQLHQLRGRVGRGQKESYCLLFTESTSSSTITRLKSLETSHNGAELAELDLKMRGAGDMYGTIQHGSSFLKIASFTNFDLLNATKKEAQTLFPQLSSLPLLQDKVKSTIIHKVSPD